MYKLSEVERQKVLGMEEPGTGSVAGEADEASIRATLPVIPGLEEANSSESRLALLTSTMERQRAAFIATYGSPFADGVEENHADRTIYLPVRAIA